MRNLPYSTISHLTIVSWAGGIIVSVVTGRTSVILSCSGVYASEVNERTHRTSRNNKTMVSKYSKRKS